jgi:phytoene desaturase
MTTDTIVIGGGLGGLAAAITLAAAGRSVSIVEQLDRVGGKLNLVEVAGFSFDTGPSLLTMPWVLRELFATAGTSLEAELTIEPVDPLCRYVWSDGSVFDMTPQLPRLAAEIARIEPADVAGFSRFLGYTAQIYDAVAEPFLARPFRGLRDMVNQRMLRDSLRIDPLRTVDQSLRTFFRSPRLRQVFGRYATYNGSSPFRAPATFNLISYVELTQGGWHVRGGMYQITRALERTARRLGVSIHTGVAVSRIVERDGAVAGVQLADGSSIAARTIVANVDPRIVAERLRATPQPRPAGELSYSGFVLMLGVRGTDPLLRHHTIFFSDDYRREFDAIVGRGVPAEDPTVYVCAPSVSDPSVAPPDHSNLFILVNAPHSGQYARWPAEAARYRELVLDRLERNGLAGLRGRIVVERMLTPHDLEQRYAAPGGAIYGLASNTPFAAFLRPAQRSAGLRGLYFAGGGTHPGGGIPLVLLSGRAAAQHLLADAGQTP